MRVYEGVIENEHLTDVASPPPPPPRVCNMGVIENEHLTDVEPRPPPPPPRVCNMGVIENEHLTDVEPRPPPPRACMRVHQFILEGESCSNLGQVIVMNVPLAR